MGGASKGALSLAPPSLAPQFKKKLAKKAMYEQKEGGIILASIRTSFVVVLKEIGEGASGGALT